MSKVSFLIPVAPSLDPSCFEAALRDRNLPVRLVQAADTLLLTVSGTATLEAAILGTPMIIINRVSDLSYYLGRHLIRVNYIGLPNLVAGQRIVSEFVQNDARPEVVAAEALNLLEHPERLEVQRQALGRVRNQLGEPGVAERVARLVLENSDFG